MFSCFMLPGTCDERLRGNMGSCVHFFVSFVKIDVIPILIIEPMLQYREYHCRAVLRNLHIRHVARGVRA